MTTRTNGNSRRIAGAARVPDGLCFDFGGFVMRDVVFVFGSNLAGRHGKGAALEAARHWGAEYGVGEGRTGNAYAVPTKDANLRTLPLPEVSLAYSRFRQYAAKNPETQFLLTPFGTGLAGYTVQQIEDMCEVIAEPLRNVWLTGDWFA